MTSISPMPITSVSMPVTNPEVITAMSPPVPCEIEQIKSAWEEVVPVPLVEVEMQPTVDNKMGSSYIMEAQVTHVENVSCNTSISSSDMVMQEYLKNHFNEQLNDKFYSTFKELSEDINIDSMKKALPKVSIYNNILIKLVDEINSKYVMALTFGTP